MAHSYSAKRTVTAGGLGSTPAGGTYAGTHYTQHDSARFGLRLRLLFQPKRLTKFMEHRSFHHRTYLDAIRGELATEAPGTVASGKSFLFAKRAERGSKSTIAPAPGVWTCLPNRTAAEGADATIGHWLTLGDLVSDLAGSDLEDTDYARVR